jgi:transcriptional regulator with XRE-family HTH domain
LKKKPEELDSKIGDLIKKSRTNVGISQMKLAEKIDVSYQQLQKYESGATRITVSRIVQIASALGVPVRTFLQSELSVADKPYIGLSEKETQLIRRFRKLKNDKLKENVISMVDNIIKLQK